MPSITLASVLQLIIGATLLNVWLLRPRNASAFRGGAADSLKKEFAVYGLPAPMFYFVGALKVLAGIVLVAGIWLRLPVALATIVVATLMVGAIGMHIRVKDPLQKSVPAFVLLAMCVALLLLR